MTPTRVRRAVSASFAAVLVLGGAACSDEDGDGGTTDEELEDVDQTVDSVGDELEEEVDSQSEGSDEDGE
jgi:hypothetical protein